MISSSAARRAWWASLFAAASCLASQPALAQDEAAETDETAADSGEAEDTGEGGETDILSAGTLSLILDARLVLADGGESFADGGFGKTRFDGTADGDFRVSAVPVEAALIWQPRFTGSLSGNVSAAWQNDQEHEVDLLEAYLTFIPRRSGSVNFSAKAGLYWPEISLEHATGGAWSTVYTITPSAINAWVGEEVKVVGAEGTLYLALGDQDISLTAGAFGFDDTSGTLLSFRGWALHDMKATAFGHFPLPPLPAFYLVPPRQAQETKSLYEIDDRVGFYGRAEWRPSPSIVLNVFYYDNRGDPQAFTPSLQWGWRTKFWNAGLVADLTPELRLIAQGMTGTTKFGFSPGGVTWVDTRYRSAFALLTHRIGAGAVSGRIEAFDTDERGSRMDPALENETGWAATAAVRWPVWDKLTLFVEGLHVESERGARVRAGLPAKENQSVLQAALRLRW